MRAMAKRMRFLRKMSASRVMARRTARTMRKISHVFLNFRYVSKLVVKAISVRLRLAPSTFSNRT